MEKKNCSEGKQPKPRTEVLNEKQAAAYLNLSLAFLRRRRSLGTPPGSIPGPKYAKLGKAVRYRREDLDDWLEKYLCEVA